MQPVCHSERSAAQSKNLRTYSHICGEIDAKILRLPAVAQDDTGIPTVQLMIDDSQFYFYSPKIRFAASGKYSLAKSTPPTMKDFPFKFSREPASVSKVKVSL